MVDITRIYTCKICGVVQRVICDDFTLDLRELWANDLPGVNLCRQCLFHQRLNCYLAGLAPWTSDTFESHSEQKLWFVMLPSLKARSIHVFNQVCTIGYRLDFYLPEFRLAIEVDGRHHLKSEDAARDEFHRSYKIDTVRFGADAIWNDPHRVLDRINGQIARRPRLKFEAKRVLLALHPLHDYVF